MVSADVAPDRGATLPASRRAHQLRETEIQIFASPRGVTNTFAGLMSRCTMPLRVRGSERIDHLNGELDDGFERKRPAPVSIAHQLLERLALEQFHGDERIALVPANLVDDADVWVVQRGGGTCLTLEPLESQAISRHVREEAA